MEPPQEPSRIPEEDPNPTTLLTPSKRTTINNTRPFLLSQRPTRTHALNLAYITTQLSQLNQILNSPRNRLFARRRQVKCQHCNGDFDPELIHEHADECESRNVPCPHCDGRVPSDALDTHIELCSRTQTNAGRRQSQPRFPSYFASLIEADDIDGRAPLGVLDTHIEPCSRTQTNAGRRQSQPRFPSYFASLIEADDMNMDFEEIGIEEEFLLLDEEDFTYERLLRLDETIVKKGISIDQLKDYPTQLYVKSLDGEGGCSICLSDYETGEYTRELPCEHRFHKGCIDKWLETNITCPMCKKYLR